jgi:hypothetical protein
MKEEAAGFLLHLLSNISIPNDFCRLGFSADLYSRSAKKDNSPWASG